MEASVQTRQTPQKPLSENGTNCSGPCLQLWALPRPAAYAEGKG
uniref:Uncharacterized protein n=1 Tax=Anguilla anguilla TaxID=7936 RepID=A0A0E9QFB7_ANGAN